MAYPVDGGDGQAAINLKEIGGIDVESLMQAWSKKEEEEKQYY
jgi:hypothetical protein